MKIIKRNKPEIKTEADIISALESMSQDKMFNAPIAVEPHFVSLPDDVYETDLNPPKSKVVCDNATTFTAIDKSTLHISQWMRHIYPANKGDISWMFKTEKGMWFKIEVLRGFATVSYGHGNIHSENAHWVKTHTWKESGAIQAMKQRAIAEEKFKLEKPNVIAQKAIEEDII